MSIYFNESTDSIIVRVHKIKNDTNSTEKKKIKNIFQFFDIYGDKNKILSSIELKGYDFDSVRFNSKQLPKGYEVVYNGYPVLLANYPIQRQGVRKILNAKAKFVDKDDKLIKYIELSGGEQTTVKLDAPDGYTFLNDAHSFTFDPKHLEKTYVLISQNSSSKPDKTKLTTKVTLMDKDTKKTISQTSVTGKQGTKQTVKIPAGYKLAPGFSNVVNMDKNTGSVTIQLVKVNSSISVNKPGIGNSNTGSSTNKPGSGNNNSNSSSNKPDANHNNSGSNVSNGKIESYPANVSTHFSGVAPLHDNKGREVRNRALMENSSWHVDKKMTLNGETFYRVATHEWVSAKHVYEYSINKTTIQTSTGNYKQLYNSKGQLNKTRALASNTSWATDKIAMINGVKMRRVATDEWVATSDLQ